MITTIRPVEVDGQFFIDISIDGCELPRRGPFATIDEVEVTANRLAAICRGLLHHPVHITQWKTPVAAQTTSPLEKQRPSDRSPTELAREPLLRG